MEYFFSCFTNIKFLIAVNFILYLVYKWAVSNNDFFEKLGVDYVKAWPILGNFADFAFGKKDFLETIREYSEIFAGKKVFGIFHLRAPVLVINDPDLVKQIAIKDFDHFTDHREIADPDMDKLFSKNLFNLMGDKWKTMRSTLSPAFTGSKMRMMFELVTECGDNARKYLLKETDRDEKMVIDIKDFFTRYTNDVIATCAFGIHVDSLKNRTNEFYETGKMASKFEGIMGFKILLYTLIPKVMKFFGVRIMSKQITDFFSSLVLDAMRHREENKILRPDMINLLLEMKKGILKQDEENEQKGVVSVQKFEDDDFVAQCFIFFLAGFETTSSTFTFMAYELMVNKEAQEKLIEEVDRTTEELKNGVLTYEALQKMKYMEMVMMETLRKWSPVPAIDRVCTKSYVLETGDKKINIKVGDLIWLNVAGTHYNPEIHADPEKFDPERFSDENKDNITPTTHFPFGVGPRICIGNRFAIMECKAIFYFLLSKFTLEISEKTQIPMTLAKMSIALKPEKGVFVHLKPRTKKN